MTSAPVALDMAMISDSLAALRIASSCSSASYHLVEKPDQTVTSVDSLKE